MVSTHLVSGRDLVSVLTSTHSHKVGNFLVHDVYKVPSGAFQHIRFSVNGLESNILLSLILCFLSMVNGW